MFGAGGPIEIIVTDLTRFANENLVCMAGIHRESGQCIRPRPYLDSDLCRRLGLLPGAILRGRFARMRTELPHSEDRCWRGRRVYRGTCRPDEFRAVLEATARPSIEEGFSGTPEPGQKYYSLDSPPPVSLITLSVAPREFRIVSDLAQPERIRATFRDRSGREFPFLSITDLGFCDHVRWHARPGEIAQWNHFIHSQDELFLRIGISREHEAPDGRVGYWMQVNGIYTFPRYLKEVRRYQPTPHHAP